MLARFTALTLRLWFSTLLTDILTGSFAFLTCPPDLSLDISSQWVVEEVVVWYKWCGRMQAE